jgi:hypothetical protein
MMMIKTSTKGELGGLKVKQIGGSFQLPHPYLEEAEPITQIERDDKLSSMVMEIPPRIKISLKSRMQRESILTMMQVGWSMRKSRFWR